MLQTMSRSSKISPVVEVRPPRKEGTSLEVTLAKSLIAYGKKTQVSDGNERSSGSCRMYSEYQFGSMSSNA